VGVVVTTTASNDTSSIGSITDDFSCSPCNTGIICRSGAATLEASIEAALKDTTCPMSMDERESEATKPPLSTQASVWQGSDGGGEGVVDTTTT
jgi:hypothetical protein